LVAAKAADGSSPWKGEELLAAGEKAVSLASQFLEDAMSRVRAIRQRKGETP